MYWMQQHWADTRSIECASCRLPVWRKKTGWAHTTASWLHPVSLKNARFQTCSEEPRDFKNGHITPSDSLVLYVWVMNDVTQYTTLCFNKHLFNSKEACPPYCIHNSLSVCLSRFTFPVVYCMSSSVTVVSAISHVYLYLVCFTEMQWCVIAIHGIGQILKSLECMSVCVSVSPHKPFVHDSDRNFCPIFLKFGTWVTRGDWKCKYGKRK